LGLARTVWVLSMSTTLGKVLVDRVTAVRGDGEVSR
jgi:hypothetical protein